VFSGDDEVDAGAFSGWLRGMQAALRGAADSDVPCGGCTACCRSSQFVHIAPDETQALAAIPPELLFPAPRLPRGHVVLGYDDKGHCPLLVDGGCSIYAARPHACRTYDCRVYAATGTTPRNKPLVAERIQRWRFSHPEPVDAAEHDAVRAAADFLADHDELLPADAPASQRAIAAIEVHDLFLGGHPPAAADVRDRLTHAFGT
jgi:Fe-S-cluster containining protein